MILALVVVVILICVVLPLAGLAAWTIITSLLAGLVIGALARLVVPGRQSIGLIATIVLGLAGSFVGGLIGRGIHVGSGITFLLEVVVAAVFVAVWTGGLGTRAVGRGGRRPLGR